MRKYHGVLFDLDGTLAELRFKAQEAKLAVIREIEALGLTMDNITSNDHMQIIFDKVEERIMKDGMEMSYEQVLGRLTKVIERYEVEAAEESVLAPDAAIILNRLRKGGCVLGIVTNTGRRAAELFLSRSNLNDSFDVVITRNEIKRLKPSGDGLRKALQIMSLSAGESLYVGDSVLDVAAAKDAGVDMAAVIGGIHRKEALLEARPTYLISSLQDLIPIVC